MDGTDEVDRERLASRARDTQLIHAIRAGDSQAFGQLYDKWFDRIYDLAHRIVHNPDIAAEVAQDTFLKAWRSLDSLENPDAFGGWLLRIARNAAYNRSAREGRSSAFDDQGLAMIESVGASPSSAPAGFNVEDRLGRASSPESALEDREAQSLVWQAAAALPARDVEVLDLQLRHGLSPAEIGDVIGMNRNAANQLVHRLRGRLETAIRARVLWRDGQPSCAVLAARLHESGIAAFGADAVKVIERHMPGCDECDEKQRMRLQPAALFAAAPLLIAPQLIKQSAASALEAAGVPMQGSAFSSFATGGLNAAGSGAGTGAPGQGAGSGAGSGPGSGAGSGAGAGGPGAAPVGVQGAVATVTELGAKTTKHTVRNSLLAAAAVVVVIAGLVGVLARRGGDSAPAIEVAASGSPATSGVTTTVRASGATTPPSTTVATTSGPIPTTSGGATPSTSPVTQAPPTTSGGAPTTQTTRRPATTTTTAPTTTTTAPPVDATITMTPATRNNYPWPMTATVRQVSPTLSWNVVTKGKVTVAVEGPAPDNPKKLLSAEATGSQIVCPGTLVNLGNGQVCNAPAGTYTYTLTVNGADGKAITTKTATLALTQYVG
jgi:RNA polymerase sigma factor (sigma-70 family)